MLFRVLLRALLCPCYGAIEIKSNKIKLSNFSLLRVKLTFFLFCLWHADI